MPQRLGGDERCVEQREDVQGHVFAEKEAVRQAELHQDPDGDGVHIDGRQPLQKVRDRVLLEADVAAENDEHAVQDPH